MSQKINAKKILYNTIVYPKYFEETGELVENVANVDEVWNVANSDYSIAEITLKDGQTFRIRVDILQEKK